MRSSRGFASTAPNLIAHFRLAFASAAPQSGLTLLVTVSRRIIMQKARHHPGSGECECRVERIRLDFFSRHSPLVTRHYTEL